MFKIKPKENNDVVRREEKKLMNEKLNYQLDILLVHYIIEKIFQRMTEFFLSLILKIKFVGKNAFSC